MRYDEFDLKTRKFRTLVLMMGFLALPASPSPRLPGPQEVENVGRPLQYEVLVALKLIHVYVTDKKGKPVQGLTKDDFVVYDNKRPMAVTDFEKHVLSPPVKTGPEPTAAGKGTPIGPSATVTTQKFFLFFDFAFNNPRGIAKAKKAALHFLDTEVRPDDEVGCLSYSMIKGVTVHEYLTTDHRKIREVLETVDQRAIAGRASEIEDEYWRLVQEPLPGVRDGMSSAQADMNSKTASAQREESKKIVQTFILRLTALAKALRYVPGQKQFILFSTGVPSSLIYGSQAGNPSAMGDRSAFDAGDRVLRTQNEEMYREFSTSGSSFYAFDTRDSAKVTDLFAYDRMTFETGGRGMFNTQGVFQDTTSVFKDDKTTGLNSLKRLTDITGGRYYSNINMFEKNLDQVQNLTGTYYVLGYAVGETWDGQFHEVKIEVTRKGCEVRAQAGYFNPKPYRDYTDLEKQLHLFDLALNERAFSRMPVNFPMTTLSYTSGNGSGLEILAKIPGGVIGKFSGKRLEFVTIVFDGRDNILDVRRLEADPGSFRGHVVVFAAGASLKPGDYTCRLVLRDMDTGMSAVASARGTVDPVPSTGLQLHTPLLLLGEAGSAFLDAGSGKAKNLLWWGSVYPFDRMTHSPVLGEVPRGAARITAVVPCSFPGPDPPDINLSVHLINVASGEKMPVPFSLLERVWRGPVEILRLEFPVDGLPPGGYVLYLNVEDPVSKALSHARTSLVITL